MRPAYVRCKDAAKHHNRQLLPQCIMTSKLRTHHLWQSLYVVLGSTTAERIDAANAERYCFCPV
eukprot:17617-Heterococcus_DN1.PRE.2